MDSKNTKTAPRKSLGESKTGQSLKLTRKQSPARPAKDYTFERLRVLSNGLTVASDKANGLYRELVRECARLLANGQPREAITRELLDTGRSAPLASQLLTVATLPHADLEEFLTGAMSWRLALESSRLSLALAAHARHLELDLGDISCPITGDKDSAASAAPPASHLIPSALDLGELPGAPPPGNSDTAQDLRAQVDVLQVAAKALPPAQGEPGYTGTTPPAPAKRRGRSPGGSDITRREERLVIQAAILAKLHARAGGITRKWEVRGYLVTIEPLKEGSRI